MSHRAVTALQGILRPHVALGGRTAANLLGPAAPKRKPHGHLAKSWFRIGFDRIRNLLRSDPVAAIAAWLRLRSKPGQNRGVV